MNFVELDAAETLAALDAAGSAVCGEGACMTGCTRALPKKREFRNCSRTT